MAQIVFIETPRLRIKKRTSKTSMAYMHHHHAFEIFYIIKGEREYFVENRFFKLSEGDLMVVPKDLLHRTAGKEAWRFLIYFEENYLKRFFTDETVKSLDIDRPFVFRPKGEERERLNQLFGGFFNEYNRTAKDGVPEDSALLAGYLYQILFTVSYGNNTYVSEEYSDSRIGSIVKYINESYCDINDIEEIAERFYISKYHLCRLFSKNLGVGLITYLNTIKIRKACEMLGEGAHSVTEVATACGFNSSSYFCKVFKAEKGISPSEYKKQQRVARGD